MSDEIRQDYFNLDRGDVAADDDEFRSSLGPRDDYPIYDLGEGLAFQPIYGQNLLLNFVHFEPNGSLPSHQHPEEQAGTIIEGEIELTVGDETRVLKQGDVYMIPPYVPHAGRTFEQGCIALDIFSPPRSGFRELIARAKQVNR